MDDWKERAACQAGGEALHDWARLEAKSPQMVDDLLQRYAPPEISRRWPLALGLGVRLAVWLVEAWSYLKRH